MKIIKEFRRGAIGFEPCYTATIKVVNNNNKFIPIFNTSKLNKGEWEGIKLKSLFEQEKDYGEIILDMISFSDRTYCECEINIFSSKDDIEGFEQVIDQIVHTIKKKYEAIKFVEDNFISEGRIEEIQL